MKMKISKKKKKNEWKKKKTTIWKKNDQFYVLVSARCGYANYSGLWIDYCNHLTSFVDAASSIASPWNYLDDRRFVVTAETC